MSGSNGFTPNILVFGRNPNTPTVLSNELPALKKAFTETVRENLNAMHAARKAFIQKESSEKIKGALRHNVRTGNDSVYKNGGKVYFKRNNNKWNGPGTVIGQEHKQVLIKSGSEVVRVHTSRTMHVNEVKFNGNDNNQEEITGNNVAGLNSDYDINEVQHNDSSSFNDKEDIENIMMKIMMTMKIYLI